jgi:hypothetical protein
MIIIKMVLKLIKQKVVTVYRPLKVVAFNANGIWRRSYELSRQLQDLHYMWLFSQRRISNPMRGSSFKMITYIGLAAFREEKAFPTRMKSYAMRYAYLTKPKSIHCRQIYPLVRENYS